MKPWLVLVLVLMTTTSARRTTYSRRDDDVLGRSSKLFKVALSQKGYIQFLRYHTDVPDLHDFTYCLWVKSQNFTHPHPLFSYSRHETERLVRGWMTPSHDSALLQMEILEVTAMRVRIELVQQRWYHICQGWSTSKAHWNLHINGVLVASGGVPWMRGMVIPGGGDIVVGQELTDSEKGLDDGIEGEVFGFNLVQGDLALGRQLARTSFHHCTAGRGTPHLSRGTYIVSWPQTPVHVFGGAAITGARPQCGHF